MRRLWVIIALVWGVNLHSSDLAGGTDPAWQELSFEIEDTRCFVGIAGVYLSVSELKPENGYLVGRYEIRVPLRKSKNDSGKIYLPLEDTSVDYLGRKGGVLRGKALSDKDEEVSNLVVCEIIPEQDQAILLSITTNHRTLSFESRYTVIEGAAEEELADLCQGES